MDFLKSVILPVVASSVLFTNLNKHNAVTHANNNRDTIAKMILDTDTNAIAKQETLHDLETKDYWKRVALDFKNNVPKSKNNAKRKAYQDRIYKIALQLEQSQENTNDLMSSKVDGLDLSDTTGNNLTYSFQIAFNNINVGYSYTRNNQANADSITYSNTRVWTIEAEGTKLKWTRVTTGMKSDTEIDGPSPDDSVIIDFGFQKNITTIPHSSSHKPTGNQNGLNSQPVKQPANKKRVPE